MERQLKSPTEANWTSVVKGGARAVSDTGAKQFLEENDDGRSEVAEYLNPQNKALWETKGRVTESSSQSKKNTPQM
ncbi:hypothetical protein HPG69_011909 [Diceros bicornis minor]|uniref:Uncharacterized protein n=1 Tax=Diceros bicornis minor TaxID=77932 RepID=A0A7J7ERX0_DICBM|nr:hypothetical protein HPG69_011909 [Diceros bicornis minor]